MPNAHQHFLARFEKIKQAELANNEGPIQTLLQDLIYEFECNAKLAQKIVNDPYILRAARQFPMVNKLLNIKLRDFVIHNIEDKLAKLQSDIMGKCGTGGSQKLASDARWLEDLSLQLRFYEFNDGELDSLQDQLFIALSRDMEKDEIPGAYFEKIIVMVSAGGKVDNNINEGVKFDKESHVFSISEALLIRAIQYCLQNNRYDDGLKLVALIENKTQRDFHYSSLFSQSGMAPLNLLLNANKGPWLENALDYLFETDHQLIKTDEFKKLIFSIARYGNSQLLVKYINEGKLDLLTGIETAGYTSDTKSLIGEILKEGGDTSRLSSFLNGVEFKHAFANSLKINDNNRGFRDLLKQKFESFYKEFNDKYKTLHKIHAFKSLLDNDNKSLSDIADFIEAWKSEGVEQLFEEFYMIGLTVNKQETTRVCEVVGHGYHDKAIFLKKRYADRYNLEELVDYGRDGFQETFNDALLNLWGYLGHSDGSFSSKRQYTAAQKAQSQLDVARFKKTLSFLLEHLEEPKLNFFTKSNIFKNRNLSRVQSLIDTYNIGSQTEFAQWMIESMFRKAPNRAHMSNDFWTREATSLEFPDVTEKKFDTIPTCLAFISQHAEADLQQAIKNKIEVFAKKGYGAGAEDYKRYKKSTDQEFDSNYAFYSSFEDLKWLMQVAVVQSDLEFDITPFSWMYDQLSSDSKGQSQLLAKSIMLLSMTHQEHDRFGVEQYGEIFLTPHQSLIACKQLFKKLCPELADYLSAENLQLRENGTVKIFETIGRCVVNAKEANSKFTMSYDTLLKMLEVGRTMHADKGEDGVYQSLFTNGGELQTRGKRSTYKSVLSAMADCLPKFNSWSTHPQREFKKTPALIDTIDRIGAIIKEHKDEGVPFGWEILNHRGDGQPEMPHGCAPRKTAYMPPSNDDVCRKILENIGSIKRPKGPMAGEEATLVNTQEVVAGATV